MSGQPAGQPAFDEGTYLGGPNAFQPGFVFNGENPGTWVWDPEGYYGIEEFDRMIKSGWSDKRPSNAAPVSTIPVSIDRNQNGVPDNFERKVSKRKHRVKHRLYF